MFRLELPTLTLKSRSLRTTRRTDLRAMLREDQGLLAGIVRKHFGTQEVLVQSPLRLPHAVLGAGDGERRVSQPQAGGIVVRGQSCH